MSIVEWIPEVTSIVMAVSSVLILRQIDLLKKQTKDDHERSRREKAVSLLLEWSKQLNQKSSITRKFVDQLSEEAIRCIYNQESFCLSEKPKKNIKLLLACLGKNKDDIKKKNGQVHVTESDSAKIRWEIINYLNALESVISAWAYQVADRDLVEDEFGYLFSNEGIGKGLKYFRLIAGGESSYPCIEAFEQQMKEKNKKEQKAKYELG